MMSMMMGGAKYGVGGATGMTSPRISLSPDPPSPTNSDSSNSNNLSSSPPPTVRGSSKECGVCSDVAKSMHFGGLSCDSCKAFFRRSVQNNAYKGFSCPYEKKCVIGVSSRKACQYCRFEKCIFIGMEKGWVMSEDERKKMMEQRKERKIKQTHETTQRQYDHSLYSLSEEDRREIASIVSLYKKAYNTIPYDEMFPDSQEGPGNGQEAAGGNFVLGPWMTFCKRIAYFFSLFRDFAELSAGDQSLLLRTALTSAGIIMGSVVYDSSNGKWAAKINKSRTGNLNISAQSVEKLVPSDLISRVDKFFKKFQQVCPDETMAMILILVSLYSPELMGLEARERVQHLQERYIHILQNYVKYKFREKSSVMFPKAIVSLADIRELADRTGQMQIHGGSASMFSGFSSMMQRGPGLGSPYTGLSLSNTVPHSPDDDMAPVCLSGPKDDPTYQRIMKLIYQIHGPSLNSKAPTLLPLVIQILKKWAHAKQESRTRAITGPTRRNHRHSRPKTAHRGSGHRSRRIGNIKGEPPMEEGFAFTIKEEVMDHSEEALQLNQEGSQMGLSGPFGGTISSQEFIETFPQIQQQHFQQVNVCRQPSPVSLSTNVCRQPSPAHISTGSDSPPIFHTASDISQPSEVQYILPHTNPYRSDGSPLAYPHAMSPDEGFHSVSMVHSPQQQTMVRSPQQQSMARSPQQHSLSHSPLQHQMVHSPPQHSMVPSPQQHSFAQSPPQNTLSHSPQQIINPHIQVTESPHMPPMSPFSSHQQVTPPGAVNYQPENTCCSSLGPSPSPYSSSSSSSSPEDVDSSQSDIFHEDLSKTEVDVIMQLMERVSSFDFLERANGGGGSVTDILPMPLLKELQSKLCSLTELGVDATSSTLVFDTENGIEPHMVVESRTLPMDQTITLGTTEMEVYSDDMDVDTIVPLNNGAEMHS